MDPGSTLVWLGGIGAVTGIVAMLIDKRAGARDRQLEVERQLNEQRLALQEQRLIELERHTAQLEQELAWHRKLADAQPARPVAEGQSVRPLTNPHLALPHQVADAQPPLAAAPPRSPATEDDGRPLAAPSGR
jgi:hypothetical protein